MTDLRVPNIRVVVNLLGGLKTTGPELGWKISNALYNAFPPNKSTTNRLNKFVIAIERRFFDVAVNTLAPLYLQDKCRCFQFLYIRQRALVGCFLNTAGFVSSIFQSIGPTTQARPHVAQALKYLYRGGLDATLCGSSFVLSDLGTFICISEAIALLIAPNLVRSLADRFFKSIDNFIDRSLS